MLLTVIHLLWVFKMINRFKKKTALTLAVIVLFVRGSLTTSKTLYLTNPCLRTAWNSERDGTCLLPKVVKVYINKSICSVPLSRTGTYHECFVLPCSHVNKIMAGVILSETSRLLYYECWQCRNITL